MCEIFVILRGLFLCLNNPQASQGHCLSSCISLQVNSVSFPQELRSTVRLVSKFRFKKNEYILILVGERNLNLTSIEQCLLFSKVPCGLLFFFTFIPEVIVSSSLEKRSWWLKGVKAAYYLSLSASYNVQLVWFKVFGQMYHNKLVNLCCHLFFWH